MCSHFNNKQIYCTQRMRNHTHTHLIMQDSKLLLANNNHGLLLISYHTFLQARPCDKFGYGVMVTQVAATTPGVVALHSSGTSYYMTVLIAVWKYNYCTLHMNYSSVCSGSFRAGLSGGAVVGSGVWERGCEGRSPQVHPNGLHWQQLCEGKISSQFFTVLCASTLMVSLWYLLRTISRTTRPWHTQSAFLMRSERTYYRDQ